MGAGLSLGAAVGFGVFLIVVAFLPKRRSLAVVLHEHRQPGVAAPIALPVESSRWVTQLGRRVGGMAARLTLASVPADLRLLGRTQDRHMGEKAALAVAGLLLPPATAGAVALGAGINVPVPIPLWGSVLLALGGFVLPDLGVRGDATARRRDVCHALGSFLDLAVINLAGGAGVERALTQAANGGSGPSFALFQRALDVARISNLPPWETLGRLGDEVGVPELGELAARMQLAGVEGARVRQSLEAMAVSLRARLLADAEAHDRHATVLMTLAVALMVAGYLILVVYPQLARITAKP